MLCCLLEQCCSVCISVSVCLCFLLFFILLFSCSAQSLLLCVMLALAGERNCSAFFNSSFTHFIHSFIHHCPCCDCSCYMLLFCVLVKMDICGQIYSVVVSVLLAGIAMRSCVCGTHQSSQKPLQFS